MSFHIPNMVKESCRWRSALWKRFLEASPLLPWWNINTDLALGWWYIPLYLSLAKELIKPWDLGWLGWVGWQQVIPMEKFTARKMIHCLLWRVGLISSEYLLQWGRYIQDGSTRHPSEIKYWTNIWRVLVLKQYWGKVWGTADICISLTVLHWLPRWR